MRRQQWETCLRQALLAFRDSEGETIKLKVSDFASEVDHSIQHAYRLLEGYDSEPSRFNRIGRKPGLLDFGWIEKIETPGPRQYRLADSGREESSKIVRFEKQKDATLPASRPIGDRRRRVPDDLGLTGSLIPGTFSDLDEDLLRRIEIARRFELRGEHRESLAVYRAILSELKGPASLVLRVWLMLRMAAIHYLDRNLDLSNELTSQAERELSGGGPPWIRGWLLLVQGNILILKRLVDDAMVKLLEAEVLARRAGDMYLLRLTLHSQGEAHLTSNLNPELAYKKFQEALEVAEEAGDARGIGYEKWNLGRYLIDWGSKRFKDRRLELEKARELAKEGAEIAEGVKNYHYAALAYVILGEAEEALGRVEDDVRLRGMAAVKTYRRVLKLGLMLEDNSLVANSASHLAMAYYRLGKVKKAEEAIQRLTQISTLPTLRVTRQWWLDGQPVLGTGD